MITVLRHFFVDTWFGRALVLLSFVAFIGLGGTFVGLGGAGLGGGGQDVVLVGRDGITPQAFGRSLEQRLAMLRERGVPSSELAQPGARGEVAHDVLRELILTKEAGLAAQRNGISVSDDTIRETVFAMPAFRNAQGVFDPKKMNDILQRNGLDHAYLVDQTKRLLLAQGVLLGLGDSARVPPALIGQVARFLTAQRTVDLLKLPFADGKLTATPDEAQLRRFYDNHPADFKEPEFRHARIVLMTPESVAASLEVPDKTIEAVYKEREREYNLPELRTVEVMSVSSEAQAQAIAKAWEADPSWKALQARFPDAIPATLADARQSDFPDDALAKATFSHRLGQIVGPIKTAAGWSVLCVTGFKSPHVTTLEQAREGIRDEIRKMQAPELLKTRLKSFEEAVAGSTTLEKIPADIGAVPASGSLDAHGLTEDGTPAPLPGSVALRTAVIKQIFAQPANAMPHVVTTPDGSAFAVVVDRVQPGRLRSFDDCRAQVETAWESAAKKRAQDALATQLLQQAKKTSLAAAVTATPPGTTLKTALVSSRLKPLEGVPAFVAQSVFRIPVGKTEMLEADGAFWLIDVTDAKAAPADQLEEVRRQLTTTQEKGLQADIFETLGRAYTKEAPPKKFDPALFERVTQGAFQQAGIPMQPAAPRSGHGNAP